MIPKPIADVLNDNGLNPQEMEARVQEKYSELLLGPASIDGTSPLKSTEGIKTCRKLGVMHGIMLRNGIGMPPSQDVISNAYTIIEDTESVDLEYVMKLFILCGEKIPYSPDLLHLALDQSAIGYLPILDEMLANPVPESDVRKAYDTLFGSEQFDEMIILMEHTGYQFQIQNHCEMLERYTNAMDRLNQLRDEYVQCLIGTIEEFRIGEYGCSIVGVTLVPPSKERLERKRGAIYIPQLLPVDKVAENLPTHLDQVLSEFEVIDNTHTRMNGFPDVEAKSIYAQIVHYLSFFGSPPGGD